MANPKRRRVVAGFSRMDLIVTVVAVIVLGALGYVAAVELGEQSRRASCRSNLRQIGRALQLYAQTNNLLLPDCTMRKYSAPGWPWDLNTNVVAELEKYGAGRKVLYCPSNPDMNDTRHFDFFSYNGGRSRVLGYSFYLNGNRQVPHEYWNTTIQGDGKRPPAKSELVTDATGAIDGDYANLTGRWPGRSNHLVPFSSHSPAGGNIEFLDEHAEWRPFKQMQHGCFTTAGPNNNNPSWDF
jgi:hypothetical protein